MLIFRCTTVQESREFAVLGKVSPSFCTRPRVSLGGGLRRRYDPVQNGSEADVGREMPRRVATVAVYGPWGRVSGRQSQAAGLLPLSKRAAAKSCFGQECSHIGTWVGPGSGLLRALAEVSRELCKRRFAF